MVLGHVSFAHDPLADESTQGCGHVSIFVRLLGGLIAVKSRLVREFNVVKLQLNFNKQSFGLLTRVRYECGRNCFR